MQVIKFMIFELILPTMVGIISIYSILILIKLLNKLASVIV